VRPAQDLELAAAGLVAPFVPDVEPRIASFADEPGGPSWSAALDRVFRSWIEVADIDGAARALSTMTAALPGFTRPTSFGLGTYELLRARLALARRDNVLAKEAGWAGLELFRVSSAPWWIAKAIRLLERAGSADHELVTEVEQIEARLRAISPSA
jgi:hypothetical protein